METEKYKLLKELTVGFSTQARLSNQYWLALMIVSIVSISNLENFDKTGVNYLPFNLGKVGFSDFIAIILLLITALSIAFASAFLQAQRTRILIQKLIDNIPDKDKFIENIHIQDIFDSNVSPTFNRVAPIAQFIQGRNQFFGDKPKKKNRILATIIYLSLKVATLIIVFIVPLIALYKNFILFSNSKITPSWGLPVFLYWFICGLTAVVFLTMIVSDINYIFKVVIKLNRKK